MTNEILRRGGPLNIQKTGRDQYTAKVTLPQGIDGRLARECPVAECSPGYFKVTPGTGITVDHLEAFCPYCRHRAEPSDFTTREQIRFAEDSLMKEVHEGVDRMIKQAFGLGHSNRRSLVRGGFLSMDVSYKPGSRPHVRRPVEDQVRRDVVCPQCGLDHSVYGLANWCADCGADIFLTHVSAEFAVIETMLGDVERRREALGERIASKDLENGLEDTVSIFEAVLKITARKLLARKDVPTEEIEKIFRQMGSGFQSVRRTIEFLKKHFQISEIAGVSSEEVEALRVIFEKRHPITHNLGVIDRKYLEAVSSAEKEGREVAINSQEIMQAIAISRKVFQSLWA